MNPSLLEQKLQECSLHALLILVSKALTRTGFGDVQVLDRRHSRQKSRHGGHELLCQTQLGNVPLKVIVKVIRDSVRLRMLDELAGAVQRTRSDIGLIISPFPLSHRSRGLAAAYAASRIETMDGPALAALLTSQGIGVRKGGEPDWAFFQSLEDASAKLLDFLASNSL
jgi:restriction endonuclease Mrr